MSKRITLPEGDGEHLWYDGGLLTFKATGSQTEGALLLFEVLMPRGKATPLHVHDDADETFYLLDGQLATHCDGDGATARRSTPAPCSRSRVELRTLSRSSPRRLGSSSC